MKGFIKIIRASKMNEIAVKISDLVSVEPFFYKYKTDTQNKTNEKNETVLDNATRPIFHLDLHHRTKVNITEYENFSISELFTPRDREEQSSNEGLSESENEGNSESDINSKMETESVEIISEKDIELSYFTPREESYDDVHLVDTIKHIFIDKDDKLDDDEREIVTLTQHLPEDRLEDEDGDGEDDERETVSLTQHLPEDDRLEDEDDERETVTLTQHLPNLINLVPKTYCFSYTPIICK